MWPDNETSRDFLNFSGVADTVGEIILQAKGRPISIGVSGSWGVGKSSMIQLIRRSLKDGADDNEGATEFIFVDFNAWLYQGYDDARAALMDVIADKLRAEADIRKTGFEKIKELLGRIDWLRAVKISAGTATSLALGLGPMGAMGDLYRLFKKSQEKGIDQEDIVETESLANKTGDTVASLVNSKSTSSPPKEINALRECFEEILAEMNVTLVVFIDDLDRCLPSTTISTLEAIRLFLFLQNTAFIIAADNSMIKHAVKKHFDGVEDQLVTSYFDKLIQIPIRVPPLGTQEVRAYMLLLFVENSDLSDEIKERIRSQVCQQLSQSWQGKRVDAAFMQQLYDKYPSDLITKFETADRLAPLMTTASQISGNPRLIKRFLNALSIRMAISHAHGVGVDEAVLAKMLLFERSGSPKAYEELLRHVNEDEDGKPRFLFDWEEQVHHGNDETLPTPWDDLFVKEWLAVSPRLADLDLRGVLYVSREHAPLITPEDRLSSEAAEVLTAILQQPDMAGDLQDQLKAISRPDLVVMMSRLLDRARREQIWGTPDILDACLALTRADPAQGSRLAGFLSELPTSQIEASIVPKISTEPWAAQVFDKWESQIDGPVKKAIQAFREDGNITV